MRKINPQYYGVAEQIVLSVSNMAASLVVVKTAGLKWFGIYSFIFVMATLISAFFSNLLHRQMVLLIASSSPQDQKRVFIATVAIQAVVIVILGCMLALFVSLFSMTFLVTEFGSELITAAVFVAFYNFYDLCRQYLYVLDKQAYSLRRTLVYIGVLIFGIVWIVLYAPSSDVVASMYGVFGTAFFISLISNRQCHRAFREGEWVSWVHVMTILKSYFAEGRFRLVGMLVTWAQNQSMNPVLMWLGGPLVAGYFSMARLMVMPMAVVNHGLTNSTTSELRRCYEASGAGDLHKGIARYMKLNFMMAALYCIALMLAHATGALNQFVPEYEFVKWFLAIWVVTLLVTMYRHWLTQFFIVSMQFRFLMNVSIAALAVSMSGMISTGYFLENVHVALVFVIVGELLTIVLFKRHLSRDS